MNYKDSYSPIDPDFYEIFGQLIEAQRTGKIFFFGPDDELQEASGMIQTIVKKDNGEFIQTDNKMLVRIDKIITIFGRPGPAYDAYDRYANACLTCEDLGQF